MIAGIRVRPVAREDFDEWKVLWDGYNAFYGRSGPRSIPETITRSTWARFFDAKEPVRALVAEADGKLVGITHYLFHRSTTKLGDVCYLQDLFTAESMRGKGVGRALIEAVYAKARQAGSDRVYWQTHETNAVARELYDKLAERSGFIVYRKDLDPAAK